LLEQSDRSFEERFEDYKVALEEEGNFDALSNPHLSPLQKVPPPDFTHKWKIMVGFAQICTNIASSVNIQWPVTFQNFIAFFDATNADYISASSVECISEVSFYTRFLTVGVVPLVMLAAFFLFVFATEIKRKIAECRNNLTTLQLQPRDENQLIELPDLNSSESLGSVSSDQSDASVKSTSESSTNSTSSDSSFSSTIVESKVARPASGIITDDSRELFQLASSIALRTLASKNKMKVSQTNSQASIPDEAIVQDPQPVLIADAQDAILSSPVNVNKLRAWRMCLFLILFLLPSVANTILRLYQVRTWIFHRLSLAISHISSMNLCCLYIVSSVQCTEVDGIWYLNGDFRTQCYDAEHNRYAKLGVLFIIVYPIGVPLFLFFVLHSYRDQLHDERVNMKLGLLYAGFRPPVYWFEMVYQFLSIDILFNSS
jgi:hypothetical protein